MQKKFSSLLTATLLCSLLHTPSSLAATPREATPSSPQAKLEALRASGILTGTNEFETSLDQSMNRAQFARVAALILGLDGISTTNESPYSSLLPDRNAGALDPSGDITRQELAAITVHGLKISPVSDAPLDGVSEWAQGYVQAAINAGLITTSPDFQAPATKKDLIDASYGALTITTFADTVAQRIKNNPEQAAQIIQEAIGEKPELAALIAEKAAQAAPNAAETIAKAATQAAPGETDAIVDAIVKVVSPEQVQAIKEAVAQAKQPTSNQNTAKASNQSPANSSIPNNTGGGGSASPVGGRL